MCEIVDLDISLSDLYNFIWKEMPDVFLSHLNRESSECCACMTMSLCLSDKTLFCFVFLAHAFEAVSYWKLKYCKDFVKRFIVVLFEVPVTKFLPLLPLQSYGNCRSENKI